MQLALSIALISRLDGWRIDGSMLVAVVNVGARRCAVRYVARG